LIKVTYQTCRSTHQLTLNEESLGDVEVLSTEDETDNFSVSLEDMLQLQNHQSEVGAFDFDDNFVKRHEVLSIEEENHKRAKNIELSIKTNIFNQVVPNSKPIYVSKYIADHNCSFEQFSCNFGENPDIIFTYKIILNNKDLFDSFKVKDKHVYELNIINPYVTNIMYN
jgi:hypothetical protein